MEKRRAKDFEFDLQFNHMNFIIVDQTEQCMQFKVCRKTRRRKANNHIRLPICDKQFRSKTLKYIVSLGLCLEDIKTHHLMNRALT